MLALLEVALHELQKVSDWLTCNKLSLNPKKTQCIIFGNEKHEQMDIKLNNSKLSFTECVNVLGVLFDKKLTFVNQISKVRTKTASALGALCRCKNLIPKRFRKQLYYAFIQPHFTYGLEIWGGSNKTNLNPMFYKIEQSDI